MFALYISTSNSIYIRESIYTLYFVLILGQSETFRIIFRIMLYYSLSANIIAAA